MALNQADHWTPTAFANKKVLISGHTGFKGSWLSLWLAASGARVYGLSLPPDDGSLFKAARVYEDVTSFEGDIRDQETVESVFRSTQPEIVVHMAAQSLVRRGYADPINTYTTNVTGTVNVLEAARAVESTSVVLVVTSDKCYDNPEQLRGLRETDRLGGRDPYSSSKACAEIVTEAYRSAYFSAPGLPLVATVRAGNVIGGGDWAEDRLVPDIARAISSNRMVTIRNPTAIRPWQYVLEPLRGYLMLAERLLSGMDKFADAWNFGPSPEDELSVEDFVREMITSWGDGAYRIDFDPQAVPEAGVLRLDTTKARRLLGYEPRMHISEAIKMAADWYRRHAEGPKDMRIMTLEQLRAYESPRTP